MSPSRAETLRKIYDRLRNDPTLAYAYQASGNPYRLMHPRTQQPRPELRTQELQAALSRIAHMTVGPVEDPHAALDAIRAEAERAL